MLEKVPFLESLLAKMGSERLFRHFELLFIFVICSLKQETLRDLFSAITIFIFRTEVTVGRGHDLNAFFPRRRAAR